MKINILKPDQIITNDWSIIKIATERCPSTWEPAFEASKEELSDISDIIEEDKKANGRFYPDCDKVFRPFNLTPLHKVKVVIFGQEPIDRDVNDGLAFSVNKYSKLTPSLINIFKEIGNNYQEITKNNGDLSSWAHQGVLLLNACLTVRPASRGCHGEIWLGFIKKVINSILDVNINCIFVLWGNNFKSIRKMLGERATVLEGPDPSYYSFSGCNHFKQINDMLIKLNKQPIKW